ncbi:MAG: hypothetical protein ACRCYO_13405 [Bacteroidia bacterium]
MKNKRFKDRDIVKWCKQNAPELIGNSLEFVGDITGIEIVENLGKKISDSDKLTDLQKEEAYQLVKLEFENEKEISKRWSNDMVSDSWLSKSVRPIILLYSWLLITILCILAFFEVIIPDDYTTMVQILAMAVNVAYFGSRGIEKYQAIRKQ